ncbi:MAG: 6,7-dimethyl-8-ribityllumazine synthase [Leptospirillum sp. Group II 'C75']|uniref:6,7-dimethyl-8-ribityllumazine synthase n=1 Tax=Leptospirillum TaxID=179 RepID=UPI0000F0CCD7|nr:MULTISPECIES: 6,7-dimethyl-8-ribityllumazine synthase [Leptospirillum]EAY56295.1 MAG: 6,7-dimethyl-8-ribityllumazine synthase [Leptospirillum rubarum]EIJ76980.1 MAG: 6,7-dimethyl-8-ribityllumazine synthase [Leptospirillum sp. Group II 'C75']
MEIRTIPLPTPPLVWRVLVIQSEFNSLVTDRLLSGCLAAFRDSPLLPEKVDVLRVPGAMEIPSTLSLFLPGDEYDAAVVIGCVIRGDTGHYEAVVDGVTSGVVRQSQIHGKPVIFGVLTVDSLQQALDRVGGKAGDKGREAGEAAYRMAQLFLSRKKKGTA